MATRADTGVLAREGKVSLVDSAEHALRTWLATGRHRPGERLPPEQELSARLGISRGTLRTALRRLEKTGEIVRRQGSGTYVGRASSSTTLDEGLEKLVSYYELARRRGVKIELEALEIEERRLGPELGRVFGLEPDTTATAIERVLRIDGTPGACMTDVVHPGVSLPTAARLRQSLERGQMVLDVLLKQGVPVAYARTHVTARLVTGRDRIGRALNVSGTTAALDIEELTCTADGAVVEHSTDIFLPTSLDLHVMRWLEDSPPVPALERPRP